MAQRRPPPSSTSLGAVRKPRGSKPTLVAPKESLTDDSPVIRAWSDAGHESKARAAFRVPDEAVLMNTDPGLLPEKPKESGGLFEMVGNVARRALALGLASREPSFHVFVAAAPEVMIEDDIRRFAEAYFEGRPPPFDIVYVHDFDHPEAPRPLLLPVGVGPALKHVMDALVSALKEAMPEVAHTDEVQRAQRKLARALEAKSKELITNIEVTAKNLGFGIRNNAQGGMQTFPVLHGKPLSPEQYEVLDESTKRALSEAEDKLTQEVERAATLVRDEGAKYSAARNEAMRKAAERIIDRAMKDVVTSFARYGDDLAHYLVSVRRALAEDWEDLVTPENQQREAGEPADGSDDATPDHDPEHATRLQRFKVNVLVAHAEDSPPPVIYETNPTYPNLFGYLERRARFGALLTDFTRIRAGSLHRASGGVLIVRAADLMADPIIWERMKRVLREGRLGAEDPLGPLGLYATTLKPKSVPIGVRVVLVGTPDLYAALLDADPDFAALFRVKVEVEQSIPRTKERLTALDAYLMQMAEERGWGTFDRKARARLLDLSTRLAGDKDKLSLSLTPLEETAAFASATAQVRAALERGERGEKNEGALVVTKEDIEIAWRDRRDRAGAAERHIREMSLSGELALDTEGLRVGVVNGLSVYSAGDVEFGQPMRITAVVALGREGIVDVEREAQLGGSIHAKGVAILRGYLGRMFGQERPLSLRAQIAFEQSYGEIDGDSASSSELFAVLSALADLPIDQSVAVTGSVNQLGEMQTIGGLCAKIEGFFDLCAARGLTGAQGVLLPRPNLRHLVLREDVAKAIRDRRFHLFAADNVAQGIEILTGVNAGERDASGRFPAHSVFGRVERRIIEIAERLREAEGHVTQRHETREPEDASSADLGDGNDFRGR
jgi:predicted ATP-dependent protease